MFISPLSRTTKHIPPPSTATVGRPASVAPPSFEILCEGVVSAVAGEGELPFPASVEGPEKGQQDEDEEGEEEEIVVHDVGRWEVVGVVWDVGGGGVEACG